jgi:hypothetical protein
MSDKAGPPSNSETSMVENVPRSTFSKWRLSRSGDGDTALALFSNPDELHEDIDPKEEKQLIRKIDLMILPYLAVCYAFFYIDKASLFFNQAIR